jgi:hypothetical protein
MPTPRKANPQKRGRKPAWRDGYLEQARKLAVLGLTDAEMAKFLGVSLRTFMHWKISNPEFLHALKEGKEVADLRVVRSLYERAVGYSVEIEKIFCCRGKVIRVKTVEQYPPDTTSMIFWLRNRRPDEWRDKIDVDHRHVFNFIGMLPSEEEWLQQYGSHQEPLTIAPPAQVIEDDDAGDTGLD